MATSTNYGWAEPDNTSLVKDGAQAIRTLGDAIDTSLWNSGYGQAGKNKIINGDFGIWQRGTSFTLTTATDTYCADRFLFAAYGSSTAGTVTRQTFTPGTAPVAGYEGQYFARLTNFATATAWQIRQRIENVQTYAGQTVTFSFYAKASAAISNLSVEIKQNFGSGGSTAVTTTATSSGVISTAWVRYSYTIAVPSISGKTVGTSSYLEFNFFQGSGATNSSTIDTWGWQAEYGSKATPFQTATGTIQGELAACQRYFFKTSGVATYSILATGVCASTTQANAFFYFPVTMRTSPTVFDNSSLYVEDSGGGAGTSSTVAYANQTTNTVRMNITGLTGLTANRPCHIFTNNSNLGYISASAEL